jgi:hypothetical protein
MALSKSSLVPKKTSTKVGTSTRVYFKGLGRITKEDAEAEPLESRLFPPVVGNKGTGSNH